MADVNIIGGGLACSELGNWPKAASVSRKRMYTDRARAALKEWLGNTESAAPDDGGGIAVETSGAALSGSPTS